VQTPGPGYLLEYLKAGFVLPLDEFATEYGWEEKILPWAYQSGIVDGKLYGLPLTFESMIVLYNTAVFEELGLEPPTNRAEFEAAAEAIKASGRVPIAYGNVGWQPTNEHLAGMWLNAAAGSQAVYEALIGERTWADPVFVDAINLLTDHIATKGYFGGSLEDYYSLDWETFFSLLQSGDAGMMTIGTWGFRGATDFFADNPDEWDWMMMPSMNEGVPQGYDLAIGSTVSISSKSANPEAAAEVLNWLYADPKRAAEIASIFSFGEFVVPIQFGPEDFPADTDPRISRFFTEFGEVTGAGNYGYTTWTFWPAEAETQLWKDIELVWAGEETAQEYLAAHQALWDKARTEGGIPPIPER
jgi:raffinose/stachyose/melibiose transport system substrate-binding protein